MRSVGDFKELITLPPYSILFILVISFVITLATTLVSKRTIDYDKMRYYRKIVAEYTRLQKEYAFSKGDKRLAKKLEKMKPAYSEAQAEMTKMSMRPMLYTTLPLLAIFWILRGIYFEIPIVRLPFALPMIDLLRRGSCFAPDVIGYVGLYFMSSFMFSMVLQRLLGISLD